MSQKTPAVLVLADGSVFRGVSIGAEGTTVGEVVFNTAMTGYQEILTDPSYAGQIVTLTYPHIGNVGANSEDAESTRIHAAGLIIRDLPLVASNWRQDEDLSTYLKRSSLVAIGDIDTRRLTRLLRSKGAQNGCIVAGNAIDEKAALARANGARANSTNRSIRPRESAYSTPASVATTAPRQLAIVRKMTVR